MRTAVGRWIRDRWTVRLVLVAAAVVTALALVPFSPAGILPAAVSSTALVVVFTTRSDHRLRDPALTAGAGIFSLAVTVWVALLAPGNDGSPEIGFALLEAATLAGLILLVVRDAPGDLIPPAVLPAGLAMATWILRFGPPRLTVESVAGCTVWGLAAVAALAVGLYLRRLESNRARSVRRARRVQRATLARDLHDFVAHDISSMLAQAQAGQIVAEIDPAKAVELFQQIELTALEALASLDRTVHMLGDEMGLDRPAALAPQPGVRDLPALLTRFAATIPAEVSSDIDVEVEAPREVGATMYRIVVEALTNIRRHAPGTGRVRVTVGRSGSLLEAAVVNATGGAPADDDGGRHGGSGLLALAAAAEALGGTLVAGPAADGGWQVTAALPLGSGPVRPSRG